MCNFQERLGFFSFRYTGQAARLDQGMEGLCQFYVRRRRCQEGEAACRTAASGLAPASGLAAVEGVPVRAKTLVWQSLFNQLLGRTELAHQLARQNLVLLEGPEQADQEPVTSPPKDTRPAKAFALWQMGRMMIYSDYEEPGAYGSKAWRCTGRWVTAGEQPLCY